MSNTLIGLVLGVLAGIWANSLFVSRVQKDIITLDIPVLITAQDAQGGQFQLGVRRAMEWAAAYGLDEIGVRRIRPRFLDEKSKGLKTDEEIRDLVEAVTDRDPPIIIGPLTSTSATKLVPPIAVEKHIPMILGIPTTPSITEQNKTNGRVWRLSPSDKLQAQSVAHAVGGLRPFFKKNHMRICILQDSQENPEYSRPLSDMISKELGQMAFYDWTLSELKSGRKEEFDGCFNKTPEVIIFVGMASMGRTALIQAKLRKIVTRWIFTDGCIDRAFVSEARNHVGTGMAQQILMTFQGPYPDFPGSGTLQQYAWYTRSLGGAVAGVVDVDNCKRGDGATSYEVFGFDSYLIALRLLKRASQNHDVTNDRVAAVMQEKSERSPDLLMGPYEFNNFGDNTKLDFHVYELTAAGCLPHSNLCPNNACIRERERIANLNNK